MKTVLPNAGEGFDEIVFENRNKSYGAYALRQSYPFRVNISFGMVLLTLLSLVLLQRFIALDHQVFHPAGTILPEIIPYVKPEVLPEEPPINICGGNPPAGQNGKNEVKGILIPVISQDSIDQTDLGGDEHIDQGENSASSNKVKGSGSENHQGQGGDGYGYGYDSTATGSESYVDIPDTMPEFPGGEKAFFRFLTTELKYPRNEEVSSVVYVSFIIGATGRVGKIDIIQSGGRSFDREVERVIARMPDWKPGKMRGQHVSVRYKMPVRFSRGN